MLICESCGFQQVMAQSLKSQKVEPVLSSMVADCLAGLSVIGTVTHTNTNKVMAHEYPYIYIYIYIRDGSVHVSVPFGSKFQMEVSIPFPLEWGLWSEQGMCVPLCSRLKCTWRRERCNFLIIISCYVPVTTQHGVRQQIR